VRVARVRRSAVAVDAERRFREQGAHLGGAIKEMRIRRRWTQNELARRANVGRLVVGRLERGVGPLDVETLDRIALALEVPLAIGFDRDLREDARDAGHLAIQELVLGITRRAGFARQFEMPTRPSDPWRSIDVGLALERSHLAIDAECWNTFGDLGAAVRSSRRKAGELEQLAIARWGADARAALVWIVRETVGNRVVANRYPEVFASVFTGSSRAWVATLTSGSAPPEGPGFVWCDLGTGRLHAWNRPRRATAARS
jgi:transcriptional regulator with XRE-family HTH domain